mgnify:CR=1 FL=1
MIAGGHHSLIRRGRSVHETAGYDDMVELREVQVSTGRALPFGRDVTQNDSILRTLRLLGHVEQIHESHGAPAAGAPARCPRGAGWGKLVEKVSLDHSGENYTGPMTPSSPHSSMAWLVGEAAAFDRVVDLGDQVIARLAARARAGDADALSRMVEVRAMVRGLDGRDSDAVAAAVALLEAIDVETAP